MTSQAPTGGPAPMKMKAISEKAIAQGAIDMAFGQCHLPMPDFIQQKAHEVLEQRAPHMYAPAMGIEPLRKAIREKLASHNKLPMEAGKYDCLVTNGATGALVCALITLCRPGDEILVFEPFFPAYPHWVQAARATMKTIPISLADLSIDWEQVEQAITPRTKAILLCNPNNPCGKVFTHKELVRLGRLAQKHDLWIVADEVYEHITYPGHTHISIASLEDFAARTITVFSFSKTYHITGWRLGYAAGPAAIIEKMGAVHTSVFYICAPAPLQHAVLAAFPLHQAYLATLRADYLKKRDWLVAELTGLGFGITPPQGACYLLADCSAFPWQDDGKAVQVILQKANVAVAPGRSFYLDPAAGGSLIRFCYALELAPIEKAIGQLKGFLQATGGMG